MNKKQKQRLQKHLDAVTKRISIWNKHVEKLEKKAAMKVAHIKNKIKSLQNEAKRIKAMMSKVEDNDNGL